MPKVEGNSHCLLYTSREFDRAAPYGTGRFKVGGNYAASLRANKKAHDLGYSCEFYLDAKEKKYIDECGAALYIRPLLICTGAQLGVYPANEYLFVVFVTPVGPYFKGGFSTNPYVDVYKRQIMPMWHIVHFRKECQVVCPVIYAVRCRDICTSLLLPLPIRVGRLWGSSCCVYRISD